jgi:hypothetical protein
MLKTKMMNTITILFIYNLLLNQTLCVTV